jgi:hypothetical protein
MPPRSNPFPTSTLSQVWTTIVRALRSDPVLGSRVDSWCVFDGSDDDLAEPTDEDMPHLRLEPVAGQGGWLDENAHKVVVPIKLTLGVAGTDVTALFDFWDAIRAALFTGNAVLQKLYPLGVIQKTLTLPATEARRWGDGALGLSAVGTLLITMRVDS